MFKSTFNPSGVRSIDFVLEKDAVTFLKKGWQSHVTSIPEYPKDNFIGKGIVISAGGIKYFTCAWILIKNLRTIGCNLPIELWHLGPEISDEIIEELKELDVLCRDFLGIAHNNLTGVMLKPLAIVHSSFKEILFLDADNNCINDPSYLFESKEYLDTGAIFWPDYWTTAKDNPIWKIVDSTDYNQQEQESGQILIDKERCWKEINLCLYFNIKHEVYHKMLYGDKDTFKFAWIALKSKYHMIERPVSTCGYLDFNHRFRGNTMVQHDPCGDLLFLHRNLLKWDITKIGEKVWQVIRTFNNSKTTNLIKFDSYSLDLEGDYHESLVPNSVEHLESKCLVFLKELRGSSFYCRYFIQSYILNSRGNL